MPKLEELADVFLHAPTPWVASDYRSFIVNWPTHLPHLVQGSGSPNPALPANANFAIMCITAVALEFLPLRAEEDLGLLNLIPKEIRVALLGRFLGTARGKALLTLESFSFSPDQQDFLARWIKGEIDFVVRKPRVRRPGLVRIPDGR